MFIHPITVFKKERERKKRDEPFVFDVQTELKHGSKFYNHFLQKCKEEWIQVLLSNLDSLKVPETEDHVNTKLGQISFTVGDLNLKDLVIPKQDIALTFQSDQIQLTLYSNF